MRRPGGTRSPPLVYPPSLTGRRRTLANRYLAAVDPGDRQTLLDELQGRLESERKGMRPVYDEIRFLHALCRAQRQGRFVANLGIRVMEARQARMRPAAPPVDEAQKAREAKERERTRALGRQHLARLRKEAGHERPGRLSIFDRLKPVLVPGTGATGSCRSSKKNRTVRAGIFRGIAGGFVD